MIVAWSEEEKEFCIRRKSTRVSFFSTSADKLGEYRKLKESWHTSFRRRVPLLPEEFFD